MSGSNEKTVKPNPLESANFLSKYYFWWLKDLILYGRNHDLEPKDLYDNLPEDSSEKLGSELEKAWTEEQVLAKKSSREPSLHRTIMRIYKLPLLKSSIYHFLFIVIQILQPQLLVIILSYFQKPSKITKTEAYLLATLFVISTIALYIMLRHAFFRMRCLGLQMRVATSSLMIRKLVKLSNTSATDSKEASIINLLSNDAAKFNDCCLFLPFALMSPALVVVTVLMNYHIGYLAATVGALTLVLQSVPLQVVMYKITLKLRSRLAPLTDQRITLINEVIDGIRAIKMYVLENYFEKLVHRVRRQEIHDFLKMAYASSIGEIFKKAADRVTVCSVILTCILNDIPILAKDIVIVMQYASVLQMHLSAFTFLAFRNIADINASIGRIQEFLLREEVDSLVQKLKHEEGESSISMKIDNLFDDPVGTENSKVVDIEIPAGELHVIIGAVGSGKSTLLKTILGEVLPRTGEILIRGNVSYASQDPWLFSGSIRDNIIFGQVFDEEKYNRVLEACELVNDCKNLPYGDKTLVGDRGMTLSGGQRARVNLARSVYREADIYLLDDPLSAVDVRVSEKLFNNCINGLLKNKTRVLVTNNIQYLNKANNIILMDKGIVKFQGEYDNFEKNDLFLSQSNSKKIDESAPALDQNLEECTVKLDKSLEDTEDQEETNEMEEFIKKKKVTKANLLWKYVRASDSCSFVFLYIISCIFVICSIAGLDYSIVIETQRIFAIPMGNNTDGQNESESYGRIGQMDYNPRIAKSLYILGSLILMVIISSIIGNLLFYKLPLNASKNLHNKMFNRIMKTPLQFFTVDESAGKILNRFSEDTGAADDFLPRILFLAVDNTLKIIAVIMLVLIINWYNIFPMALLWFFCMKLSNTYMGTSQKLSKLEAATKSPVLSFAASSLAGLITIRSCRAEATITKGFDYRQDFYTRARILTIASSQAIGLWMETACAGLVAFMAYSCIIINDYHSYFDGYVGLSLQQILVFMDLLSFVTRMYIDAFQSMVSVERMIEFTKLPEEDSSEVNIKLEKIWPTKGEINFDSLYLRYSKMAEPVLKNISFKIESGMKVGVVGRTGAGKSSLVSALFRLNDFDGSITIDGIDIKKISLYDLRSRISIIPQEPVLFNSSLRNNLDPLGKSDDATLWSALQDVELNKAFTTLEHQIDRGGSNLSLGQRQLVCLARAIIKNNKILVLDEATANVDPTTDELIQKTIRLKFSNCTVLTIAHRLNTIMDSDKILVMDSGQVIEYDTPQILLQNKDGYFSNLVDKSSPSRLQIQCVIAEEKIEKNREMYINSAVRSLLPRFCVIP